MKKRLKRILDWIVLLLTGQGPIAEEAADAEIIDYSGQGRDKYGKRGNRKCRR